MAAAENKFIYLLFRYRFWLGIGLAIAAPVVLAPEIRAQQALPPPPAIGNDELPSLAPVAPPQGASAFPDVNMQVPPLEGNFPAAVPPPAIAPSPYSSSYQSRFRVVVNGTSPYLLQQVQQLSPTASIESIQGNQYILVGEYASQPEALQQVKSLAQQGIASQVITTDGAVEQALNAGVNPPWSSTPTFQGPHYQVVVPTAPEKFATIANKMIGMGVKPEAIHAKRAPLGPHIAVGPIMNEGEAESVSRYLRSGGMDARVYYSR